MSEFKGLKVDTSVKNKELISTQLLKINKSKPFFNFSGQNQGYRSWS